MFYFALHNVNKPSKRMKNIRSVVFDHWRPLVSRWKTGILALACALFATDSLRDGAALREFESHIGEMATEGGGVLFVMSTADCLRSADVAGSVAEILQAQGLTVKGLVVRDWVDDAVLSLVLDVANERFEHVPIRARGTTALLSLTGTPVVLGVTPDGTLAVVERYGAMDMVETPSLAQRLAIAVDGRS